MPEKYNLRPATDRDASAIKKLVIATRLNPMQLKWRHFVVATDSQGRVIGCGQIRPHRDGSHELASLVVDHDYRGLGISRGIIDHLTGIHEGHLYLMCRASLGGFYEKFGFEEITEPEMPPYFKRISRLASIAEILRKEGETLLIMRR